MSFGLLFVFQNVRYSKTVKFVDHDNKFDKLKYGDIKNYCEQYKQPATETVPFLFFFGKVLL